MALRYVDHDGLPISQEDWRRRYANPDFRILRRIDRAGLRFQASWVGVFLPSHERSPKPFVVDCALESEKTRTRRLPPAKSFATASEAIMALEAMVEDYFRA